MATVRFDNVSRIYDKKARPAVSGINLEIADGEFLVLVGPSGCGKSTTLRMLAGLDPTDVGEIYIDDQPMSGVSPADRNIAMVFQNYALYPNMTVAENMSFALKNQKRPKQEIKEKVAEAARILQLEELLDRRPAQLSGGQRQRVAMGRAIVRDPAVFCMDEPLSNLDAKLRVATRSQISALQQRLGTTTVYVTHDQVEAMTMGDRVAVLKDGVLQQVASPQEIYQKPANAFVAGFIGSPAMNIFQAHIDPDSTSAQGMIGGVRLAVPDALAAMESERFQLGIRPEHCALYAATDHRDETTFPVIVRSVEQLGYEAFAYVEPKDSQIETQSDVDNVIAVRIPGTVDLHIGDAAQVAIPEYGSGTLHYFSAQGERIID